MHVSSTFFAVSRRADVSIEPIGSMLARYGISAVMLALVLMGIVVGGLVPALPIELAAVAG